MSTYPGGKGGSGVWQTIINQIPPHKFYLEPFLGAGTVMYYKAPAAFDVGIEVNSTTISETTKRFGDRKIVVLNNDAPTVLDILSRQLKTKKRHAQTIVPSYLSPADVCVYADPPYIMETRSEKGRRYYDFEPYLDQGDVEQLAFPVFADTTWHARLIKILDSLPCNVLLSGYWSALYEKLLTPPKWRWIQYWAVTRGGRKVKEFVWMNYPEPVELHDYRYLGRNRRERERIRKKVTRWQNKLANMPTLEKQALLAAMTSSHLRLRSSER